MKLSGPPQSSGGQAPSPAVQMGIGLSRLRLQTVLDADLMAPGNVQVVLVDETGAVAERNAASVTSGDDADTSHEP